MDPELIKQVGLSAAKGIFGNAAIEIYEGGYVRIARSSDGETDGKATKETPFERLISIEISQGGGRRGCPPSERCDVGLHGHQHASPASQGDGRDRWFRAGRHGSGPAGQPTEPTGCADHRD